MPTIYGLKPAFQNLLRPLVALLATQKITANQVTVASFLMSLGLGAALYLQPKSSSALLALPFVLFLRMALNAIDGMLAREYKMESRLGAVLDELTAVLSDAVLYLPFTKMVVDLPELVVGTILLGIVAEMAGVLGPLVGSKRSFSGPFGKSDRAFAFGSLGLLLGLGVPEGSWLSFTMAGFLLLTVLTIINRVRDIL